MRYFIIFISFYLTLFAKDCYWNKDHQRVCYKRFYNLDELKKPRDKEVYYIFPSGKVYGMSDKIVLKLNYKGGIIDLINSFEVEFVDIKKNKEYIFKIKDINSFFGILSNLNQKDYVKYAKPILKRRLKKGEKIEFKQSQSSLENKKPKKATNGKVEFQWKK